MLVSRGWELQNGSQKCVRDDYVGMCSKELSTVPNRTPIESTNLHRYVYETVLHSTKEETEVILFKETINDTHTYA